MVGDQIDSTLMEWSTDQILALYSEIDIYGREFPVVAMKSGKGRRICRTVNKGIVHLVLVHLWDQIKRRHRLNRTPDVQARYENVYSRNQQVPAGRILQAYDLDKHPRFNHFKINSEAIIYADPRVNVVLPTIKIGDTIEMLAPSSVCEVGAGTGRNLFYSANRFRDVRFTGYEVSAGAVDTAKRLQETAMHATAFGKLYRLSEDGMEAVRQIEFNEGSAYELPCEDDAFDVVFTVSALEQMADRYPEALLELRRISRKYVVLCEPLFDVNDAFGNMFLWARNYFRIRVQELERYGLRVRQLIRCLPIKPTFAKAIVIAEIV